MVETLAGGKGVEHLFSKYVNVFGVLGGKDYFIFRGSDRELGGKGGFSDVFVGEQNGFGCPIDVRVIFC